MSWTTLTLQVRTPLFGGDDPRQPDSCPVRVPSIRGALRFWFRAVTAGHGVSDLGELRKAEEAVFGSTSTPSAIRLRMSTTLTMSGRHSRPDWAISEKRANRRGFDGAQYLLGQGLWDYENGLRRGYVKEDVSFGLDISFSKDPQVNTRFLVALWAWLTYGGLGARTRRGFGQLECTAVDGDLPCGWTLADLRPPDDVEGWQSLGKRAVPDSLLCRTELGWGGLLPLPPEDEPAGPLPECPALAPRWWAGCVLDDEGDSLGAVLHLAGLRWRRFRAADGSDYAEDDSDYLPTEDKPSQSTRSPEWTNVIHKQDGRYPIAALGLPIGYFSRSKGYKFSATVTPYLGDNKLRRASPVWLRPVRFHNGRWSVFTHVFFAQLLPAETKLRIDATGRAPRTLDLPPEQDVLEVLNRWTIGWPRLPDDYFPRS